MLDFKDIKKGDLLSERAHGLTTFLEVLSDPILTNNRYTLSAITDDHLIKTYTQYVDHKEHGPFLYPESFGETDTLNILSKDQELVIDDHFMSQKNSFLKGIILRLATVMRMSLNPKENPKLARILGGEDYREVSRKHISTCSVLIYFAPVLTEQLITERAEGKHFFTGIGSRNTPDVLLSFAEKLSERLCRLGWGLRSGKASGADSAFQRGLERVPEESQRGEIYLPWADFSSQSGLAGTWDKLVENPAAEGLASRIHPAWEKCKASVRKLHIRNVYQVLGEDLSTPSKFVLYCAEERDGVVSGGTATAVNLARAFGIPTINIGQRDWKHKLLLALCGAQRNPVFNPKVMGRPLAEVDESQHREWYATVLSYLLACDYLARFKGFQWDHEELLESALNLWHLLNDPVKILLSRKKEMFEGLDELFYPEWIRSLAEQIAKAHKGVFKPIS